MLWKESNTSSRRSICSSKEKDIQTIKHDYSNETFNGLSSKCNKNIKEENSNGYLYTFKVKKDFLKQREKEK